MTPPDGAIVLVGMMATGKTTLASRVAATFGRAVYDSDAMIEASTGHTVAELWEQGGEAAYRDLETEALREALAAEPPGVVAAAGGTVLRAANRDLLRDASRAGAVVIWLQTDPVILARRVRPDDHRPLLRDDAAGTLRRLNDERAPLYAEVADAAVDVGTLTVAGAAAAVLEAVDRVAAAHRASA